MKNKYIGSQIVDEIKINILVPSFDGFNAAGSQNLAQNRQNKLALGTNLRKESIKLSATRPAARKFVTGWPSGCQANEDYSS